jgi:PAS domain S-box-containing protein
MAVSAIDRDRRRSHLRSLVLRPHPDAARNRQMFGLGAVPYVAVSFGVLVVIHRITSLWQPVDLWDMPFFPAAGVAVALGVRSLRWPSVFWPTIAAVFAASVADLAMRSASGPRGVLAGGAATALQAAIGSYALHAAAANTDTPGVGRTLLQAAFVLGGCAVGAAVAALGYRGADDHAAFVVHWAVGNLFSIAIVSPLLLLRGATWPSDRARRAVFAELLATAATVVGLAVWLLRLDSIYLAIPVAALVWVGARFGARGAFPLAAAVAAVASRYAATRSGPLAMDGLGLLDIHLVLAAAAFGVHLSVSQYERERAIRRRLDTATAAREAAEVRVRRLADSAFAGVLQVNGDLNVVLANEAFSRVLGRAPGELVGRPARVLFDDESWNAGRGLMRALLGMRAVQTDVRFRHADGHEVVLFGTMRGERDRASGEVIVTSVFVDVTGQRRSEQLQRELQDRVARAEHDERRRLGRALHDGPIQELAAVDLRLGTMRRASARTSPEVSEELREIESVVEHVIGHLRGALADLVPGDVTSGRLGPVLQDFAVRLDHEERLSVHLADADQPITGPIAEVLYSIGREAITNAVRHSGAANLWIRLARTDGGSAVIEIADDGVGFRRDSHQDPMHLGLLSMRERAIEVGGSCAVTSQPAGGTSVVVRVPVR